jgi:hypothetical protein
MQKKLLRKLFIPVVHNLCARPAQRVPDDLSGDVRYAKFFGRYITENTNYAQVCKLNYYVSSVACI